MGQHKLTMAISLALAASIAAPVLADETDLREGAIVCPVNPATGTQEIYLPAVYTTILETVVLQGAQTYLQFSPLKIGDDGQVIEKVKFQERVFPAIPLHAARQIIILPAMTVTRDQQGVLRVKGDPSKIIDEGENLQKLSDARAKEPDEAELLALRKETKNQQANQTRQGLQIFRTNFAPVIPETVANKDIVMAANDVFTVVQIPPTWERRSERFLTGPINSIRNHAPFCEGYSIQTTRIEYTGSITPKPFDISGKTKEVEKLVLTKRAHYLFYNQMGQRLKSSDLIESGYDGITIRFAKQSDKIDLTGRFP